LQVAKGVMADDGVAKYDGMTIEELQQEVQNSNLEAQVGWLTSSC
jgi:hypothetical protein